MKQKQKYMNAMVRVAMMMFFLALQAHGATNSATFRWFEYVPATSRGVAKSNVCMVDSFAAAEIGPQWTHINDPEPDNYVVTPDGLALTPTYVNLTSLRYSPTAVFLDSIAQPFLAATSLRYTPVTEHDFAGIALYTDASATIIFGKSIVNGHPAVVVRRRAGDRTETAFQPLQQFEWGRPVWLRVKAYSDEVSFFYSTNNGSTWTPVANNIPLPPDTILGLYTTTNTR